MGIVVVILIVIGIGYCYHRKKEAAAIRRQKLEQSIREDYDVKRMLVDLKGLIRSMNQINEARNDAYVLNIALSHQGTPSEYRNYQLKMTMNNIYTLPLYDIDHRFAIAAGDTSPRLFRLKDISKEDMEKYETGDVNTKMEIIEKWCYQIFYNALFQTIVTDVKQYFPRGWIDSYDLEISEYPYGTIDLTCEFRIPDVGSAYALNYVTSQLQNEFPRNQFKQYGSEGIFIG